LASKYYLDLATARRFHDLSDREYIDADAVLESVAGASEFHSVSCRSAETDAVDSVLTGVDSSLDGGNRKVLAICRASMTGSTPADLRSDAWIIRQNALRLLAALREFLDTFSGPRAANLARRVEARVEHGVSRDAVGLTAVDGIGSRRAGRLSSAGLRTPSDLVAAGTTALTRADLSEGVAERVVESAKSLPAIEIDWGAFPETVERGTSTVREVSVRNTAGSGRTGIRVTVNDVEMTTKTTYLSDATHVPVGVFGATDDELTFRVEVSFPDLPLLPVHDERTVAVVD
jgi:hypothetical protein